VRWIWLGAIFMSIGGLFAILDKRYRRRKVVVKSKTQSHAQDVAVNPSV